jgi:hypothetical protein
MRVQLDINQLVKILKALSIGLNAAIRALEKEAGK